MITVVCSSQYPLDNFKEEIIKSSGLHNKIEFLGYENKGEFSLTEIYNRGLKDASNDHIVFLHHDITIETKQWGVKLLRLFEKHSEYGIIGVAGSKNMPVSGQWWADPIKMYGRVQHTYGGKTWLSNYSDDLGQNLEEVVNVDGVFFAVDRSKIKINFNEEVKGFHFYDVSFSVENHLAGVKVGVTTFIRINHQSIGMTNDAWEQNRQQFAETHAKVLPINIINDFLNTNINLLIDEVTFDNVKSKLLKDKKINITILTENPKKYKKYTIRTMSVEQPFGYRFGDGKWHLKTQQGDVPSVINRLYKINPFYFDVIHILPSNSTVFKYIIKLYPESKIVVDEIIDNFYSNYKELFIPIQKSTTLEEGITFIIPTINRETLSRSVDSLLKQTNDKWKCKIIFDGVDPIFFDDSRVESYQINKTGLVGPNNGQAGLVRNYGIDIADTEWIGFLDDDDTINETYVEELFKEHNNRDFVIFKMKYGDGLVLPIKNVITLGNVGISFAYKTYLDVKFDENLDGEDFMFIRKLQNKTTNYIISDNVQYNVRH